MQETAKPDPRSQIPAINTLVSQIEALFPGENLPSALAVRLARCAATQLRAEPKLTNDAKFLQRLVSPLLDPGPKPVINATGILLHTNLGRSPIPDSVVHSAMQAVAGYTNLEIDLASGKRGHRDRHFSQLAQLVWGVEDATLVNNAAAGVALSLSALGGGGETIVSRGELVEIGGSYRLPDIMHHAGTKLVEVGTTNKTKLNDYERALNQATGCLLKSHTSNYRIEGFTASVDLADLVKLGRAHKVPVVMDLGSGLSRSLAFPEVPEPLIEDYLEADPDLLIFSGDKLFGAIQAGIILGKKESVQRLRKSPMMRMLRADKLSISILCHQLQQTAMGHGHPLSQLANTSVETLRPRAVEIAKKLAPHISCEICKEPAFMGGGSLPQEQRDTLCLKLQPKQVASFARRLRLGNPAVVGYIRNETFYVNLASVFPEQDSMLVEALTTALSQKPPG